MSVQSMLPHPVLLFVRFEQGRGVGGVPKMFVPYMAAGDKRPEITTLVRMSVQLFRDECADPVLGHGQDIMPGTDEDYSLHTT